MTVVTVKLNLIGVPTCLPVATFLIRKTEETWSWTYQFAV
jgi:hypothetical protein